nr:hypothetical protein [Streptomyces sp. SPB074]
MHDKRINEAAGERKRFSSAILSPWARKSPKSSEVRQADRAAFMDRDLFATASVQVWADGTEELIAMTDGYRESSGAWTGLPTCPG